MAASFFRYPGYWEFLPGIPGWYPGRNSYPGISGFRNFRFSGIQGDLLKNPCPHHSALRVGLDAAWDCAARGETPVAQLAREGPVYYTSKRVHIKGSSSTSRTTTTRTLSAEPATRSQASLRNPVLPYPGIAETSGGFVVLLRPSGK
eukprot:2658478-Rhodomonas_salina.1